LNLATNKLVNKINEKKTKWQQQDQQDQFLNSHPFMLETFMQT